MCHHHIWLKKNIILRIIIGTLFIQWHFSLIEKFHCNYMIIYCYTNWCTSSFRYLVFNKLNAVKIFSNVIRSDLKFRFLVKMVPLRWHQKVFTMESNNDWNTISRSYIKFLAWYHVKQRISSFHQPILYIFTWCIF